jgi:hypothetical protein
MRRLVRVVGLSVLASVLVIGNGAAWAVPLAWGTGSCHVVSGTGAFNDQITQTGNASVKQVTIAFRADPHSDCSLSITSPDGDVVTGIASLVGTGTYTNAAGFADSCENIAVSDAVKIKIKVKWIATSPVAQTRATFQRLGYGHSGSLSTLAYSEATSWTGSFLNSATSGQLDLGTSVPDLEGCTPSTKFTAFDVSVSLIDV